NHINMIGEIGRNENLAKFMHGLTRSYTAYFNRKYKKVGQLWQGRFKSKAIIKDAYINNCINYIETNPIRANIVSMPHEYIWSSYGQRVLDQNSKINVLDDLIL
ncbi:MAG: transposase, partial [Candidatus Omnitrophica bacterium]|nr:transposase [Candidatus Omnitrophota bacterium]